MKKYLGFKRVRGLRARRSLETQAFLRFLELRILADFLSEPIFKSLRTGIMTRAGSECRYYNLIVKVVHR